MYRKSRVSSKQNHPLYHASYIELLNDVIKLVTFAHSAGPGGNVRTIHAYIYIPEDCTVLLVWGEPDHNDGECLLEMYCVSPYHQYICFLTIEIVFGKPINFLGIIIHTSIMCIEIHTGKVA